MRGGRSRQPRPTGFGARAAAASVVDPVDTAVPFPELDHERARLAAGRGKRAAMRLQTRCCSAFRACRTLAYSTLHAGSSVRRSAARACPLRDAPRSRRTGTLPRQQSPGRSLEPSSISPACRARSVRRTARSTSPRAAVGRTQALARWGAATRAVRCWRGLCRRRRPAPPQRLDKPDDEQPKLLLAAGRFQRLARPARLLPAPAGHATRSVHAARLCVRESDKTRP